MVISLYLNSWQAELNHNTFESSVFRFCGPISTSTNPSRAHIIIMIYGQCKLVPHQCAHVFAGQLHCKELEIQIHGAVVSWSHIFK